MQRIKEWVRVTDTFPQERKTVITAYEEWINGERQPGRCRNTTNELLGFYVNEGTGEADLSRPAWLTDQYNNPETGYEIRVVAWMDDEDEYDDRDDYTPLSERGLESEICHVWNTNPEYYIQKKREVDDADNPDYVETRKEEIAKKGWTKWDYRDYHPGQQVPREIIEKI